MPGADPNDPGEAQRLAALTRDRLSEAAHEAREAQQSLTHRPAKMTAGTYRWNRAGIAIVGVGVLGALAIAATMIVCLRSIGPSE
jgi:hypothetical protein